MATALNQTPADGAVSVWTLIQTMLNPVLSEPQTWPGAGSVARGACGCGVCGAHCDPCSPCGLPMPPNIIGDPCSAWSAFRSGTGPGGAMTLCGLLQTSAADMAVAGNWVVMQSPPYVTSPAPPGGATYRRQLCFQRGADNTQWRITYSARAQFIQGSPGPGVTPSAADEQIILGGGTDAAPTFGTLLPADGSYRLQINVFQGAWVPGFYFVTYPLGNPTPNACLMLDPLMPGSYPVNVAGFALNQDPVVIYQATGVNTLRLASLASEATGPTAWINYLRTVAPVQTYARVPASFQGCLDSLGAAQVVIPQGLAQSVLDDQLDTARATYAKRAALGGTTGRIGDAQTWRWIGEVVGGGQLVSQRVGVGVEPYYWLPMGDVLLRWDSHTSSVVI